MGNQPPQHADEYPNAADTGSDLDAERPLVGAPTWVKLLRWLPGVWFGVFVMAFLFTDDPIGTVRERLAGGLTRIETLLLILFALSVWIALGFPFWPTTWGTPPDWLR